MNNTYQIRQILKIFIHSLSEVGINPLKTVNFIRGFPTYLYQLIRYSHKSRHAESNLPIRMLFPCITDRYEDAGNLGRHYFQQDLWAARKVYSLSPAHHIDVGSRIDGFVAHLLTFREVEVLDVRKLDSPVSGMSFRKMDLMKTEEVPVGICDSISCLHAIEHFGLGRYGDPIEPDGHLKGLQSITKLLKPGGTLLLSAPIGKERIEFNAHRVFSPEKLFKVVSKDYSLVSYSFIDDSDYLHENASIEPIQNLVYGCALFELRKHELEGE